MKEQNKFRLILTLMVIGFLCSCSSKKESYNLLFDQAPNLEVGSIVRNKGMEIGTVKSITVSGNKTLVNIGLDDQYKIPAGSGFVVKESILGVASIDVQCSDKNVYIKTGDTLSGIYKQPDILEPIVLDSAKREKIRKSLHKIAEGVSDLAKAAGDSARKEK